MPLWGNSNVYQQHMLLKLRKPILKYTLNKYHVHWLSSFKQLKGCTKFSGSSAATKFGIKLPIFTVYEIHRSGKGTCQAIEWGYQSKFWPWYQSTSACYIQPVNAVSSVPSMLNIKIPWVRREI